MVDPAAWTLAASPVCWDADGAPRSRLFGDVYFSKENGLAEAGAVFLAGCGLPDAWAGRPRFCVGELGFGCGLNVLALLELWRRTGPPGGRLHVFSIEAFPMSREEAARALAPWPEIADLSGRLIDRWPRRAKGFHRIEWPECSAVLDVAVMDALEALQAWHGAADAWFLDGFAPAVNPQMWRSQVLSALAMRSAPGARAATYTVAGEVRRGLTAAGFHVAKAPGFGRKRERLEARLAGAPSPPSLVAPKVAIVGAGIAGAALVRAFHALGARAEVLEADGPGAGASGNPAGLAAPRLDAGSGPIGALYAQALARAVDLYAEIPGAVLARGLLQLEVGEKDQSRFERIAASALFESGAMRALSRDQASAALGEAACAGALAIAEAVVVRPERVIANWLSGARVRQDRVTRLTRDGPSWRLLDEDGGELTRADIVCLAAGLACRDLAPGVPLAPLRGQVSILACAERPAAAIGAGYVIPTNEGFLFGATHDRDDDDADVRAADTERNLVLLKAIRPALAARIEGRRLDGRAGVRAVTPDFLPLAGRIDGAEGLFILSGLGSRGLCAAPLLAEHVAAEALGAPSPLPRALSALVIPDRFAARRRRHENARSSA